MKKEKNEEMLSLNHELFDDFQLEELEERMETDPFLLSSILGDSPDTPSTYDFCNPICELTCAIW